MDLTPSSFMSMVLSSVSQGTQLDSSRISESSGEREGSASSSVFIPIITIRQSISPVTEEESVGL